MKVLLVDDDTRMRQVLGKLLLSSGFESVEEAGDGEEALAHLVGRRFDLIVTDCVMPTMDGLALVAALRGRGDRTPIIMLSGEHDPALVIRAVRAGVNNYIAKPLHPATFFEKVWQTLGAARAVG